jgi:hypothetical protein
MTVSFTLHSARQPFLVAKNRVIAKRCEILFASGSHVLLADVL